MKSMLPTHMPGPGSLFWKRFQNETGSAKFDQLAIFSVLGYIGWFRFVTVRLGMLATVCSNDIGSENGVDRFWIRPQDNYVWLLSCQDGVKSITQTPVHHFHNRQGLKNEGWRWHSCQLYSINSDGQRKQDLPNLLPRDLKTIDTST
jgi:hypothetical protein